MNHFHVGRPILISLGPLGAWAHWGFHASGAGAPRHLRVYIQHLNQALSIFIHHVGRPILISLGPLGEWGPLGILRELRPKISRALRPNKFTSAPPPGGSLSADPLARSGAALRWGPQGGRVINREGGRRLYDGYPQLAETLPS